MRTLICTAVLILFTSPLILGQAPAKPAAKPPVRTPAAASAADPTAIIHTTAGDLHCTLFEKETPVTVENFIGLASGSKDWKNPVSHASKKGVPLYDGTIFHRVIPNFMIQGGDPAGNGSGDPGYTFKDEIVSTLTFDRPGRLAMANSGPSTNGSQFFITEVPTPHLNGRHTIFGQCDPAAVTLVKQIARMASDPSNNRPFHPVKITHIEIRRGAAGVPKAEPAKAAPKPPGQ
ncbi:MAG TPA: peptidylprolyl isomerase [Terriglobales bacterium]|nr:peptidylprolyl isomerase [Terriglobales bacterium]